MKLNRLFWAFSLLLFTAGCTSVDNREAAQTYYNLGNAYFELGRLNDSRKAYLRALELDSSMAAADYNLARLYLEDSKYAEAEEILLRLLSRDTQNTILLETLGYMWYLRGEYRQAIGYYQQSLEQGEGNAAVWFNIAALQLQLEETKKAEESLRRAVDYAPNEIKYRIFYSNLLSENERYIEAFDLLYPAYASGKRSKDLLVSLLETAVSAEDFPAALEIADAALEADEEYPDFLFYKAFILLAGFETTDEGLDYLQRCLDAGFNSADKLALFDKYPDIPGNDKIKELLAQFPTEQKKAPEEAPPGADLPEPPLN